MGWNVAQEQNIIENTIESKKHVRTYSGVQYLLMGLVWLIRSGSVQFLVSGSNMPLAAATKPNKPRMRNGRALEWMPEKFKQHFSQEAQAHFDQLWLHYVRYIIILFF